MIAALAACTPAPASRKSPTIRNPGFTCRSVPARRFRAAARCRRPKRSRNSGRVVNQLADISAQIPAAIGVGLRAPHVRGVESTRPAIGWLEVHAENYLGGGPPLARLETLRRDYPLSVHGVGLSLGTATGLDAEHLKRFKALIARTDPFLVSDHLSWSVADGAYLNDLLPLPYTEETLDIVAQNVATAQDAFGRAILVENPSRYLHFRHSTIHEDR